MPNYVFSNINQNNLYGLNGDNLTDSSASATPITGTIGVDDVALAPMTGLNVVNGEITIAAVTGIKYFLFQFGADSSLVPAPPET